jgi:structural maintenance of chromosome 1
MIQRHVLWKLYHILQDIDESTHHVEEATEQLHDLENAVVRTLQI